jgi:hypothetical protein
MSMARARSRSSIPRLVPEELGRCVTGRSLPDWPHLGSECRLFSTQKGPLLFGADANTPKIDAIDACRTMMCCWLIWNSCDATSWGEPMRW